MSQQQEVKSGKGGIQPRSIVITRTDRNAPSKRSSVLNRSVNSSLLMNPSVAQNLTSTNISQISGQRAVEKKDLQDLNERLAGYIEKVHYLDAQCKKLEAENEALRNRKGQDLQPIRDMFENELAQARKVIDELSTQKGHEAAKLASLQDDNQALQELINTYEKQAKDYRKKIDTLGNQIGEYEGELHTLRNRVDSLEDENAKLREIIDKLKNELNGLRADLDQETAAHIEAECLAQTNGEEAQFYKDLLDQLELLKPEPITIKGMDTQEYWNSQMKKALREINTAYDEKLEMIAADCEAKYATQLDALKNGNIRDSMQLDNAQKEIKKLKEQIREKNQNNAELMAKLAALQAEKEELARQLAETERDLDELRTKYQLEVDQLSQQLETVLEQLRALMDAKMSLELEIACYKKLLDQEENRQGLRSLVEQAIGTQGQGSGALADAIQQSKSTGSLTIQRSNKGPIGFATIDHSGGNVVIENTTAGARAKTQSLRGWKLVKMVNKKPTAEINLKDFDLKSGQQFTLWARGAKERATQDNEQIADNFSFGMGTCVWKLFDDSGNDKATLNATFSG